MKKTMIIDAIFIIDSTGSMGGFIAAAKRFIYEAIKSLCTSTKVDILTSIIEFKDHPPEDNMPSRIVANRVLPNNIQLLINNINHSGGGDTAESGLDGVKRIDDLDWSRDHMFKIAFFIGDAPILGTAACKNHFNSRHGEDYTKACRCGLTVEDIAKTLERHNVQLHGFNVSSAYDTNQSFSEFCSTTSVAAPVEAIKAIVNKINNLHEMFKWATQILYPELELNPRSLVSDLAKKLGTTNAEVNQGIGILNEIGYTEKFLGGQINA